MKNVKPSEAARVVSLEVLFGDAPVSVELEAAPLRTSALAVSCSPNTNPEEGAVFCR